jgi:hypothetical protein
MSIYVIDTFKQKNSAKFPLVEDIDFLGGMRAFLTTAERNDLVNFPLTYRKIGMFVWTEDTAKLWRLSALPNTWTEFTGGGGGSSSALTDPLPLNTGLSVTAGQPLALNASGNLVAADAASGGNAEIFGFAQAAAGPGPAMSTVVTSGICPYTGPALTPGTVLYLAVGGGISASPPADSPGNMIVRVGLAETATSLLVRVQVVGRM